MFALHTPSNLAQRAADCRGARSADKSKKPKLI